MRVHREAVLVAGVAVDHVREVELQVEPAFHGRGQPELLAAIDDPLPHLAVADHVLLYRVRLVDLFVPLEHGPW